MHENRFRRDAPTSLGYDQRQCERVQDGIVMSRFIGNVAGCARGLKGLLQTLLGDAQRKPTSPACSAVPPGTVNKAIRANGEQVDVIRNARNRCDLPTRHANTARNIEPACPVLTFMPPSAIDAVVGADDEQVEVARIPGDGGDWRPR